MRNFEHCLCVIFSPNLARFRFNSIFLFQFQFLKKFWRAVQINARNPVEILPSFQTGVANSTAIRNMQIIQNPIAAIKVTKSYDQKISQKVTHRKNVNCSETKRDTVVADLPEYP